MVDVLVGLLWLLNWFLLAGTIALVVYWRMVMGSRFYHLQLGQVAITVYSKDGRHGR